MFNRDIFVAVFVLALAGVVPSAMAARDANAPPQLPDPPATVKTVFPPSAATAGSAMPSPSLDKSPELDARACTAESHCATPSPALERVIVTPKQIGVSRLTTRKIRG